MRMMLLVLCRKDFFGIGVWRDDLIVADPFMKLASWQTRVSPALLTNVSNMFIVRGGRCSPVIQAEMEEFRTITARRAHHVGIALASLPWARRHHPALLSRLISFLLVLVTAGPGLWPNQGNRQVHDPPPPSPPPPRRQDRNMYRLRPPLDK